MKKPIHILDNFAAIYVFIMSIVVTLVVFKAQSIHADLVGTELLLFFTGFIGSFFCTMFRLVLQSFRLYSQKSVWRKYMGLLCTVIWTIIAIGSLVVVLMWSEFSIAYNYLHYYLTFQYFLVGLIIIQWLGLKLFEEEWTFLSCFKRTKE